MKVEARSLVCESMRFDLGIKYNFANSYINLGYVPNVYVNDYLEHINSFNSFHETEPRKNSPSDFLDSFQSLIKNIQQHGFQTNGNEIYISRDHELLNGAHRVSTAAALNLAIDVEIVDRIEEKYDFSFFNDKNLSESASDRGILGALELESDARLLIVYPVVANRFEAEIESEIEKYGFIFFKKYIPANFNLIRNIKLLNYYIHGETIHDKWVGNISDGFSGILSHTENSMGTGRLRFYVIKKISDEDFLDLKSGLRKLLGIGNYSLHGTDSFRETQDVIRTIAHPESLECARKEPSAVTIKLAVWLKELSENLKHNGHTGYRFCIGGSAPLATFGVRPISDLDLLSEEFQDSFRNLTFVSFHNTDEIPYPSKISEYFIDPEKHFYFLGFKFVSLKETLIMKQNRLEPKDVFDSRLIQEIIGKKTWRNDLANWATNRLLIICYWGIRNRWNKLINGAKKRLMQFPRLTNALKKVRDKVSFH